MTTVTGSSPYIDGNITAHSDRGTVASWSYKLVQLQQASSSRVKASLFAVDPSEDAFAQGVQSRHCRRSHIRVKIPDDP